LQLLPVGTAGPARLQRQCGRAGLDRHLFGCLLFRQLFSCIFVAK
jgi:hypothetical protein